MQRTFRLSTILLTTLLLVSGCDNAQRDLDSQIRHISDTPDSGQISTPDNNNTVEMLPPASGSVTDENSTVGEIKVDAKNAYRVSVKFSDNYNEKGYFTREEIGQIHFDITNLYTNTPVDTNKIDKIVLEAEEQTTVDSTASGKYFNFITYSGEEGPKYIIPKASIKPSDNVAIKVKDLSGTTNIIFSATVRLGDDKTATYKLKVPVVIEKNKSSSMAIVPIGSRYENGLYIDKFVIHVVDSYGNKAKDGTHISTGVINNPKLYSNAYDGATKYTSPSGKDVVHYTSSDKNVTYINYPDPATITQVTIPDTVLPTNSRGNIISYDITPYYYQIRTDTLDDKNQTVTSYKTDWKYYTDISGVHYKNDTGSLDGKNRTFTLNPADTDDNINPNSDITTLDTLIILANKKHHKPAYLGGYDIENIDPVTNAIKLVSVNPNLNLSGLTYVIGDEYRYIDRGQTIANGAISTFESTEVKNGIAYAELRYTPEMVGKNVFIYANTVLDNKRIGISRNVLLFGTGLGKQTLSCTNDKGNRPNCSRRIRITLNDSGKGAYHVNIGHPQIVGEQTFMTATASQTDDEGWTTVSIYGIDENKTATVEFGDLLFDEYIINQK